VVVTRVDVCGEARKSWKVTFLDSLYYCNELQVVVSSPLVTL
jgi:hypothetical protein